MEPTRSVEVRVEEELSGQALCDRGFLRLRRLWLRNAYGDGSQSEAYCYDMVVREALDAVAIVLVGPGPSICLRSCLRPPLQFRHESALPLGDPPRSAVLWEIPAGLVEPGEKGESGLRACAARETLEEVGLRLDPESFSRLGSGAFLSPGVMAEKLYFLVAEVDPSCCGQPLEDGSPLEERGLVRFLPLEQALEACESGEICDLKTETAIRRLVALKASETRAGEGGQ